MISKAEQKGSCLCGAVSIAVKANSNSVGACHCNMCLKWAGGPLLVVDCGNDVQFEGDNNITAYRSSEWAERGFCNKCGSHLFYRLIKTQQYFIPVGLLDDPNEWVFDHQIFYEEKPAYYTFANETKNLTGAEVFAQFSDS